MSHLRYQYAALLILAAGARDADATPSPETDPFAGITTLPASAAGTPAQTPPADNSLFDDFTRDNFLLRYELFFMFTASREGVREGDGWRSVYSRQSVGFEVQKKFSTATKTWLGVDYQGRLTFRENYRPITADLMGAGHDGWTYETHNAYADFYDITGDGGRLNFRIGRFYVPFGLNLATDTHGTLTQLSNERNFGFERDWYAGFYGAPGEDFTYDAYYALGSGADNSFKGQAGLATLRLGTGRRSLYENGLETGVSFLAGERVSDHAVMRSPSVARDSRGDGIIRTWRVGPDIRKRFAMDSGTLTLTGEFSAGRDENDTVLTALTQVDWLDASRRWGVAVQYRHFRQDIGDGGTGSAPGKTDSALIVNASRYFANDVGNTGIHAITLGVERQLQRNTGPRDTLVTLQYYRYW